MFKRISSCAAAILLAVNPALADESCIPLAKIAEGIVSAGVPADRIFPKRSPEIAAAYAMGMELDIPDDFEPIGLIVVLTPSSAVVHFVQPQACVKYSAIIPMKEHLKIMKGMASRVGTPA